tara:strand:- start:14410 stop:14733 length:324 start_codon:yes stop_codon:yes gene_type:complete
MISFVLKPLFWFTLSFLVLSVPIEDKPLFDHISSVFGPTARAVISDFNTRAEETVKVGKKALNQLFQSVPKNADKVEVRQSGSAKEKAPDDEYTIEERQLLEQILSQ